MTAAQVCGVRCPCCRAEPGRPCIGTPGTGVYSTHWVRRRLAADLVRWGLRPAPTKPIWFREGRRRRAP
jgi:hypothetical protein